MSHEKEGQGQENSCSSCSQGDCASSGGETNEMDREAMERQAVARRMDRIRHKILVLSGKGGVGKSTVAVNIAACLALEGKKVGIMDTDIHGPSIPKLLNVNAVPEQTGEGGIQPATAFEGIKVMSVGFFLPNNDDAVIWRGPMKYGVIRQFLTDVEWGDLDYLIVDSPPGTGDEPLSVAQLIGAVDGAVLVTTPQDVSVDDVRRSVNFCRKLDMPILGVVENMSGFVCPHCSERSDIFKEGGGVAMADQMKAPFLGAIPIDPAVVRACDEGVPFIKHCAGGATADAFQHVIQPLLALD